jgi:uncharacterized protein YciI
MLRSLTARSSTRAAAALSSCRPARVCTTAKQPFLQVAGRPSSKPGPQVSLRMASTAAAGGADPGAPAPPPPPPTFTLLSYTYVQDILERRGPHRAAHIDAAKAAVAAGKMVMAGATGDPVGGALFVWAPGVDRAEVEAFAAGDPYVKAGLVPAWRVEPYMVVAQGSGK